MTAAYFDFQLFLSPASFLWQPSYSLTPHNTFWRHGASYSIMSTDKRKLNKTPQTHSWWSLREWGMGICNLELSLWAFRFRWIQIQVIANACVDWGLLMSGTGMHWRKDTGARHITCVSVQKMNWERQHSGAQVSAFSDLQHHKQRV